MSDNVVDTAGIARSPTGEIAEPKTVIEDLAKEPVIAKSNDQQTEPKKDEPKVDDKVDDKSVLNKDDKVDDKKDDKAIVPEKYEAFKVPEGFVLDEAVAAKAGELFKGLGLTQEAGQKLVDFYAEQAKTAAEEPYKAWADQQKEWKDEITKTYNDTQLGEIKSNFSKMLAATVDPTVAKEFREAMDFTGAGNHPAFVKLFDKLSKLLGEGGHFAGKNPSPEGQKRPGDAPRSAASAIYPNLPS